MDSAQAAGVNVRRLSRYLKANPDFALDVAAARRQAEVLAQPPAPSLGAEPGENATQLAAPMGMTTEGRAAFVKLLEAHARDSQSRGCSKALDILAQLHFARDLLAIKAEAKFDADERERGAEVSAKPVIIEVPIVDQSSGVG